VGSGPAAESGAAAARTGGGTGFGDRAASCRLPWLLLTASTSCTGRLPGLAIAIWKPWPWWEPGTQPERASRSSVTSTAWSGCTSSLAWGAGPTSSSSMEDGLSSVVTRPWLQWSFSLGATDGIGKAYAEELASRGLNMILIGQEEEKLQAVAKHIADTYRVETVVMVADFSRGREIYAPIREALRDRDIGILVNDVGAFYPCPQYFTQIPEDTLWDIVNVNIAAASLMVHIVLPGMVERKKGAIVTVSSGSCCKPTPQLAAFSASKAYLDHFSRALQYEYASKGIFVQSLIPFHVTTSVTVPGSFLHRCPWLAPSPRVYAQHAVSTLGISKRTTGYWSHSIQFLFAQYMPEWLWVWGANLLNRSLRKEALSCQA
ncbi:Inactive hydroxysteroid dehydrogenase-like protein 1, partial [Lemmus lemmus]